MSRKGVSKFGGIGKAYVYVLEKVRKHLFDIEEDYIVDKNNKNIQSKRIDVDSNFYMIVHKYTKSEGFIDVFCHIRIDNELFIVYFELFTDDQKHAMVTYDLDPNIPESLAHDNYKLNNDYVIYETIKKLKECFKL